MGHGGLTFEVEQVRPPGAHWDLIIRCVGTLPDNFLDDSGLMPPSFENATLNASAVAECRALGDEWRDRVGRQRVDMVGVRLRGRADTDQFTVGQRVAL